MARRFVETPGGASTIPHHTSHLCDAGDCELRAGLLGDQKESRFLTGPSAPFAMTKSFVILPGAANSSQRLASGSYFFVFAGCDFPIARPVHSFVDRLRPADRSNFTGATRRRTGSRRFRQSASGQALAGILARIRLRNSLVRGHVLLDLRHDASIRRPE